MQQLKSGFKHPINWNKYEAKTTQNAPKQYFDFLMEPSSQGVYRLFILTFNANDRTYFLPTVIVEDYNVMINARTFFDQPIKNGIETYKNIEKIATGQVDNTTGCLLDYNCFKKHKMIAIDLS